MVDKIAKMAKYIKFQQEFTIAELEKNFPPMFINKHKKMIYNDLPPHHPETLKEKVRVTKWEAIDFPSDIPPSITEFLMFEDVFSYTPTTTQGTTEWHVNFADARLFGFFEGPLFAQDEMQVMEHPCLGSIRNALSKSKDSSASPYVRATHKPHIYSTPILIKGAKRRVAIATNKDEAAGRPDGLYGRLFAYASEQAIRAAVTHITPPSTTNLIAIEAPKGGINKYTRDEIGDAFGTAFTGFLAAKIESKMSNPSERVVVHTGNWGTGAFGGNRILMACIQLFAARVAELDQLVFHTFEATATDAYKDGLKLYEKLNTENHGVDEVLEALFMQKFTWGYSDGN